MDGPLRMDLGVCDEDLLTGPQDGHKVHRLDKQLKSNIVGAGGRRVHDLGLMTVDGRLGGYTYLYIPYLFSFGFTALNRYV